MPTAMRVILHTEAPLPSPIKTDCHRNQELLYLCINNLNDMGHFADIVSTPRHIDSGLLILVLLGIITFVLIVLLLVKMHRSTHVKTDCHHKQESNVWPEYKINI